MPSKVYDPRLNTLQDLSTEEHYKVVRDLGFTKWQDGEDIYLCDNLKIRALYYGNDDIGYHRAVRFSIAHLSVSRPVLLSDTDLCRIKNDDDISTTYYTVDKNFESKYSWENDSCDDIDFDYITKELRLMEVAHGISIAQFEKMRRKNMLY